MATEGYWMVQHTGEAGSGAGLFALDTGVITGIDVLGGTLDGTYVHNPRSDKLQSKIIWKAGMIPGLLVQTGEVITPGMTQNINVDLPRDLGTDVPISIETAKGPLTVVFRKIRDFPK